jgi:hypothetical protein
MPTLVYGWLRLALPDNLPADPELPASENEVGKRVHCQMMVEEG